MSFKLVTNFKPTGDQPQAIEKLTLGLKKGFKFQTLLGVTGSGKTFTIANVIHNTQRPALIISPNKILAAQLFQELRSFFPENEVHYFVSYYDFYQPEAYLPETDTYIAKDARINELLDQLRHATLQALATNSEFIVVASVSCIYGFGDPEEYQQIGLELKVGNRVNFKELYYYLLELQYERVSTNQIKAGGFSISKDELAIVDPGGQRRWILEFRQKTIVSIREQKLKRKLKDALYLEIIPHQERKLEQIKIFPAKFFVTPRAKLELAIRNIKNELQIRYFELLKEGKRIEAERLRRRTLLDLKLLEEKGYCPGIENYSRHLAFRKPGQPPYTLLDYLPSETIIFIDESHLTVPQLRAMAIGDRRRKENLIAYGWRLPSAIDNRPLKFEEFLKKNFQIIFVSATPGPFEREHSAQIAEQLIRPTGIVDPVIEIRPAQNQVQDVVNEAKKRINQGERVLILTLTKKSAEDLCEYLLANKIKAQYFHSDIKTLKRPEIIRDFRLGKIEVLVGVNLLREGLDLPEVSLVAILDADREGFLRNSTTLIQAMGRTARNINGKVILYADKITKSLKEAIQETERRRKYQIEYNLQHQITPQPIIKEITPTPLDILGKPSQSRITKESLLEFLQSELETTE